ncbi:right-handed parallel beta-helix repeat-containing protein [Nereida sp. MMG025]|uniref:right-handed parallel beta-helix repeat-containing protein n=1 Tax=Nereida sp. MMG025 TaxID=2909981 RepID=UPI001F39C690|nr:right-handed parallel beta-helix repeat-containing protein [Nereida sp. MMG025]MCF6445574.1 right-handed parallel beta-helix repeat-containing protein [Nereida sp. MMG025]
MNKAITDGLVLTPPDFTQGLDQWSSGDGTAGSDTYANAGNAALVPSDPDFSGCLELVKTQGGTQPLRFMGQTPLIPGCYLQVTVRVKAVSGALPQVRIAANPRRTNNAAVNGVLKTGPAVQLDTYGQVVEIKAIIGQGDRPGVDMVWGMDAAYAFVGLDLTGPTGGVVRIDDIKIEDATSVFLRDMIDVVDVRDYGAIGDGTTDDADAFEAADAAAAGRTLLVTGGQFFLGRNTTIDSKIRFEGTVVQAPEHRLVLRRSFDLPTYADAFGSEVEGFKKGFQALLNNADHEEFSLGGRQIQLTEPIDMQAAVANRTRFEQRAVISNGQFDARPSADWNTVTVTSQASYSPNDPLTLRNVGNIGAIEAGSLVQGFGVGREVYVHEVNVAAGTIKLSNPLWGANGTQNYTFRRFKYILDFSGFEALSRVLVSNIEFQCAGNASAIMLAPQGTAFEVKDCLINKPKDRGITSLGRGCQGLKVDQCTFMSNEQNLTVAERTTTVLNVNANDPKIRNNRVVLFEHFAVLSGAGGLLVGNHWFHGDSTTEGQRKAGLILTNPNSKTLITGNYVDNNFILLSNEHEAFPDHDNQFSFGGLTITGNIFTAQNAADDFAWIVVKPHGVGHFIHGLVIQGNVFKARGNNVLRMEKVDDSIAGLDYNRFRNLVIDGNTFNSVQSVTQNPVLIDHDQNTAASTWTIDTADLLPFGARSRTVSSVVATDRIRTSGGADVGGFPYTQVGVGAGGRDVRVRWPQAVRGSVTVAVRCDNPL